MTDTAKHGASMTNSRDFKAALKAYNDNRYDTPQEWVTCAAVIDNNELDEAIRFALQLAEKVCGEPSDAALKAAKAEFLKMDRACNEVGEHLSFEGSVIVIHAAVCDEMIKEIEQGD